MSILVISVFGKSKEDNRLNVVLVSTTLIWTYGEYDCKTLLEDSMLKGKVHNPHTCCLTGITSHRPTC